MFGIFKKLKENKRITLLETQECTRQEYQKRENIKKEARIILQEYTRERGKNYMRFKNPHIKVGDRVILNKYEIDYANANGWDAGPSAIFQSLQDIKSPIYAKITDVYITYSLTNECIDRFIDMQSDEELKKMILDHKTSFPSICSEFKQYVNKKNFNRNIFDKDTGIYIEAAFELEFIDPSTIKYGDSFKPQWGLNIGSFLKDDSIGGIKTKELWCEEISINFALDETRKRKLELEDKLIKLHRSY